jgi:uncharacterized protein YheU (UPF0270 family)
MSESEGIEIPYERLSSEILSKIIEEFVLREGTDYGDMEFSLEQKIDQVRMQLQRGKVVVVFDPESESVSLETLANIRKRSGSGETS